MPRYRDRIFKAKHATVGNKQDFPMSRYLVVESCLIFEILNKWTSDCSLKQKWNRYMLWVWDKSVDSCLVFQGKKYGAYKAQVGVCHRPPS